MKYIGDNRINHDLTVAGDLTVSGTTTTVNSTTLTVDDKNIELAHSPSGSAGNNGAVDGGGITLISSDGNKTFNWVNSTASWTSSEHLDLASGKGLKVNGTSILTATTLSLEGAGTIDTSGNNALAINSGSANLNVTAGTLALTGAQTISSTLGVTGDLTVATSALFVDASTGGDVGIGTTSIASGGTDTRNVTIHNSNSQATYFKLSNNATGTTNSDGFDLISGADGQAYVYNRENAILNFATNSTIAAQILANGDFTVDDKLFVDVSESRVGINTNLPTHAINVVDTSGSVLRLNGISSYNYDIESQGDGTLWDHEIGSANAKFSWSSSTAELMRLDSTGLAIGTDTPTSSLTVYSASNDVEVLRVGNAAGASGSTQGVTYIGITPWNSGTHAHTRIGAIEDSVGSYKGALTFDTRGAESDSEPTERMRITSDGNMGLGGTPVSNGTGSTVLNVNATTGGSTIHLTNNTTGTTNSDGALLVQSGSDLLFINRESGNLKLRTTDTDRVTITSAGHVGLRVAPNSNWTTGHATLQVGAEGALWSPVAASSSNAFSLSMNGYYNGSAWKYITTGGYASQYYQYQGGHYFRSASASGTADADISYSHVLTVLNDGKTGIGTSAPYMNAVVGVAPTVAATTIDETSDLAGAFVIGNNVGSNFGDRIPLVFNVAGASAHNISAAIMGEREGSNWNSALSFWTNNVMDTPSNTDTIQEKMRLDSAGNLLLGRTASSITLLGAEMNADGILRAVGSSTSTNLGVNAGGRLNLANNSATDGNFSNIGGYNSNGLVTSQINFINVSHSSRTGDIAFLTHNGTSMPERLRITSAGHVAINTTATQNAMLMIEQDSTSTAGGIQIGRSDGGATYAISNVGSNLRFGVSSNGNGTVDVDTMTLDYLGRVGIGTDSPDGTLELDSTATDTNLLMGGTPSSGSREPWRMQAEGDYLRIGQNKSSFAKYMVFHGSNVGIGTSAPTHRLTLSTTGTDGIKLGVDGASYYHLIRPNGDGLYFGADETDEGGTGADIRFNVKGSESFRITNDLDMLIGTTTDQIARVYATTSTGGDFAYWGVTTHADRGPAYFQNTNASFNDIMHVLTATRAATSSYDFARFNSGNGADVEFLFDGDGTAYADGSWQGSGADYQEYFESQSGSAAEVGRAIVLDGDKVRYYNADTDSTDDIMGVTRPQADNKNSAVVGNVAWNHWTDKYLTDDWGVYLREDVTVWTYANEKGEEFAVYERDELAKDPEWTPPEGATSSTESVRKLNPDYNESLTDTYQSRKERDEWWLIGLLGQIQVKAGEPVNPRWIKMKNISDAVELYYVR